MADTITITRTVFDRGPRPVTRGWFHFFAALASVISYAVAGGLFLIYYLKTYSIPARDVFLFRSEEIARLKGMIGKVKRKLGVRA